MTSKRHLILLDGNALLHRAWHAIPPLSTPNGVVVNAVYGFANIIEKILDEKKPTAIVVAWDLPGGTFRDEVFEDYKAHREEKEQELYDQIPMIQEMLVKYGVESVSVPGFEADDIIGSFAKQNAGPDCIVEIITGDMDSMQLVDKNIFVTAFVKGLSETKKYDIDAVVERYGLKPEQLIDLKTLMGDPSDNIPGLAGVGKKTATDLLVSYGTIKGILEAISRGEVKPSIAKKFEGQEERTEQMRTLATVVTTMKLPLSFEEISLKPADRSALLSLFTEYGFKRLIQKYQGYGAPVKVASTLLKEGALESLKKDLIIVQVEEKAEDLFGAELREIVVSDGVTFARFSHPDEKTLAQVRTFLNSAELVAGHDLKKLMHRIGEITTPLHDVMIAGYLLASHLREFDFPTIVRETLRVSAPEDLIGRIPLFFTLFTKQRESLETAGMTKLSGEMEMPLIRILYLMERDGIEVDRGHLKTLSTTFEKRLAELTKEIHGLAGREFNINSPSQLAEILFVDLALPIKGIKKTKTTFSTAAPELEKLQGVHPIIDLISEFRELSKLKSTYADALPTMIATDGRIHTTYNQTIAATGRLSSTDPNLQNIPIRTELGMEIRKAFVAPKGCVLISMDYSQFELRLVASIAKDKSFIDAFRAGEDIHAVTAAQILDKPLAQVTKDERRAAKAVNFGILYGMGVRNLARSTGLSQAEAKGFLDRYFEIHKGIVEYIELMKATAHKQGYVETLFGRRRYFPDIHSGMGQLVAASERMAMNMPIQGTQADLVKMAMIHVAEWIKNSQTSVRMLLQVHDELVYEVREDEVREVVGELRRIMESVWKDDVPLIVNVSTGKTWGSMEGLS